jgi:hypothetical protein
MLMRKLLPWHAPTPLLPEFGMVNNEIMRKKKSVGMKKRERNARA